MSQPSLEQIMEDFDEHDKDGYADDHDALTFHSLPKAEGVKHDASKIRLELLDAYAIDQLGAVLTFGAHKYAAHNWRGGIHKMRLLGALLRHTMAYLNGEDKDPESGFSHIAHAMCCCMFILGLEHRTDLDDRYKEPNGNP